MRKKVAALALGISLLTLGATVANAQFGKLLKTLKDAATELQVPTNVATPSTSPTNTLAGRWVPVAESCAGVKGVSERMIELKGKDMVQAFGSCEFPAAISSRNAYKGSMSCSDEEGGETNKSVSIAIQQNGTMLWRDSEGSSAYKKCSPAPRFPYEDPPAPVKPAAVRGTSAKAPAKPKKVTVSCLQGQTAVYIGQAIPDEDAMAGIGGVAFCKSASPYGYSVRIIGLTGSVVSEYSTTKGVKINYETPVFIPGACVDAYSYKNDDGDFDYLLIPSCSMNNERALFVNSLGSFVLNTLESDSGATVGAGGTDRLFTRLKRMDKFAYEEMWDNGGV